MKKVFIIDDDKMYLMILRRRIEKIGTDIVIETYMNGLAAAEELQRLVDEERPLPNVILLDINMPLMDGWQFLEKIESDFTAMLAFCKMYMVSTSLEERDVERARSNKNVTEYIYKPIALEKLAEIISNG